MAPKRPISRSDVIPMRDLAANQVLILTYNRITDTVEIDDAELSQLEVRGILSLALEQASISEDS